MISLLKDWFAWLFAAPPQSLVIQGTIPGRLWDLNAKRWVDDAESYGFGHRPGQSGADYALVGPVMTDPNRAPR